MLKNWWHSTVFFLAASRSSVPKNELESGSHHQNVGPKMGPFSEPLGYVPILEYYQQAPKMGPNSGPVFGPTFPPFGMHFIASQYTKKRKTGNSKITISFLSTQLRQPQERCCTCRNNDSDAIELTMNQTSDTLEAPPALGKNLNSWTQKRAYGRHRKFERQLAKPSRNLGRKPQEKSNIRKLLQACVENEKPTMETETIQRNFGNRQETDRKTTNPKKIQNTRHKTGRPNCERPVMETCTKTET